MHPEPSRAQQANAVLGGSRRLVADDESLVLRNYDGEQAADVTVRVFDADGNAAFEQTHAPAGGLTIAAGVARGVYRVETELTDTRAASRDVLVGSDPQKTALVEVGNGLVSVAEGVACAPARSGVPDEFEREVRGTTRLARWFVVALGFGQLGVDGAGTVALLDDESEGGR
jgi:hypothetical protein